jgi:hypothetical protein
LPGSQKTVARAVLEQDNFRMLQYNIGDRVCIRGLLHSDCLGRTGIILEITKSALFGRHVQRCKVDFNGKVRRILNIHLRPAGKHDTAKSAAA